MTTSAWDTNEKMLGGKGGEDYKFFMLNDFNIDCFGIFYFLEGIFFFLSTCCLSVHLSLTFFIIIEDLVRFRTFFIYPKMVKYFRQNFICTWICRLYKTKIGMWIVYFIIEYYLAVLAVYNTYKNTIIYVAPNWIWWFFESVPF